MTPSKAEECIMSHAMANTGRVRIEQVGHHPVYVSPAQLIPFRGSYLLSQNPTLVSAPDDTCTIPLRRKDRKEFVATVENQDVSVILNTGYRKLAD